MAACNKNVNVKHAWEMLLKRKHWSSSFAIYNLFPLLPALFVSLHRGIFLPVAFDMMSCRNSNQTLLLHRQKNKTEKIINKNQVVRLGLKYYFNPREKKSFICDHWHLATKWKQLTNILWKIILFKKLWFSTRREWQYSVSDELQRV